jgi:hypothetical protein
MMMIILSFKRFHKFQKIWFVVVVATVVVIDDDSSSFFVSIIALSGCMCPRIEFFIFLPLFSEEFSFS